MFGFRLHPKSDWRFYGYVFTVTLCLVASEAFSTCSFVLPRGMHDVCRHRNQDDNKHKNNLQRLSMVAKVPTSNVTIDDMMLVDNIFVDNVDVDDVKYIDDDEDSYGELEELSTIDTMEIKSRLLNLLPRMTGTRDEYKRVESYVNVLEDRYTPVQTLDFLNLAMSGEWQLLFSTKMGGPPRSNFRLRELYQQVEPNNLNGTIVNKATWDLAEDHDGKNPATSFDAFGTFSIKCSYSINQGARMSLDLDDHIINLKKGSVVPKDVERLVALLHRAIPTELFDPNDHIMDTTYLDGDLRIVRMAGPKFEGVRDIFIRRGSLEINPMS